MSTVSDFVALVTAHGSEVRYRRVDSTVPCPCLTPEGFRDPEWHEDHPLEPVCDENGNLPAGGDAIDILVKAFVQPIQSTRATRLSAEYVAFLFGEIESDDHLGIFPFSWGGIELDFNNWSQTGQDFVEYDNRRYICVNANKIPDPSDGNPNHHWEVGLRLIGERE